MHESIHTIKGVGPGVHRIFGLARMTNVRDLYQINTREENERIAAAARLYVCEKYPGLDEEHYVRQQRSMVTRCLNVILRIQEGQNIRMETPEAFQCPLSYDWLIEPVLTPSGQTYSRAEITRWIKQTATDP